MIARRRDTTAVKRARLAEIHGMLKGTGTVKLSKIIGLIELRIGFSPKKAREYLAALERCEFIKIHDDQNLIEETMLIHEFKETKGPQREVLDSYR